MLKKKTWPNIIKASGSSLFRIIPILQIYITPFEINFLERDIIQASKKKKKKTSGGGGNSEVKSGDVNQMLSFKDCLIWHTWTFVPQKNGV